MNDSKNNIKFSYLYRDAGNYKIYGTVIFPNPEDIHVNEIEKEIKSRLIDGEFFEPSKWELPPLRFEEWNDDLDHFWNEYESIQTTSEEPTIGKTIAKFLEYICVVDDKVA